MEGQKTVYAYTSLLFILDYPQFSRFFIALGAHHIHNAPMCGRGALVSFYFIYPPIASDGFYILDNNWLYSVACQYRFNSFSVRAQLYCLLSRVMAVKNCRRHHQRQTNFLLQCSVQSNTSYTIARHC